jgi:uncharacterized protein with beta-barrel porin domain
MAEDVEAGRWGGFVDGTGDFGTVSGDTNAPGYSFSAGGMTAGVDYRFDKNLVGGLLFGYSQTGTSDSNATVNTAGGQFGVYAGLKQDELHVSALLDGGLDNYTTNRTGIGGQATGSSQGMEYTAELNIGYDVKASDVKVTPFATGQFTQVDVNAFNETGSLAPLNFANQGSAYLSTDLGTAASVAWNINGFKLSPNVSAAWEHVYDGTTGSLTANIGAGSNFSSTGALTGTDAAVLTGGLQAEVDKDINAHVEYQGKVGMTNYTAQGISGGVNVGF